MSVRASVVVAALAMCAGSAAAEVVVFDYPIDGKQEVPQSDTPAFGHGLGSLDTDTNMFSWNVTYQDTLADPVGAHFHGPAGYGAEAGIQIDLTMMGSIASPIIGEMMVSDAQEADILAGLYYFNLHTGAFPGGEIRGQVVIPGPSSLALLGLGGLVAGRRRR